MKTSPRQSSVLALCAAFGLSAALFLSNAHAANSTWSANTTGNWSASGNWGAAGVPGSTSVLTNADIATFSNAAGATLITIDSATQNIGSIVFSQSAVVPGYTIGSTGGNSLILSSGGAINNATSTNTNAETINAPLVLAPTSTTTAGTYTINATSTTSALTIGGAISGGTTTQGISLYLTGSNSTVADTVSGVISDGNATGKLAVIKGGQGTWKLNGSAVNTFTGGLQVNQGTLSLDFANLGTPTDLVNSGNVLTLGGGTLSVLGKSTGNTSQTFASLALTTGGSTISLTPAGAGSTTLTLTSNAISRATGSTLSVVTTGSSSVAWNPTLTNGIIGTWASFGTGATTKYATVSGGAITGLTGTAAATAANLTDTTGGVNYDLTTATGSVAATVSANTIRYTGGTATTAPGATSFSLNGLMNAGTGVWTIGTNKITIGSDKELVVNAANNGITISSIIADNGGGASALTKTGTGALILSGLNTYSGTTTVSGGTLTLNSGAQINGNVVVNPSQTSASVSNFTSSGTVAGTLTIKGAVGGAPVLPQANPYFTGNVTLNGGSSVGNILNDGQLTIAGSTAVTLGTISTTATGNLGNSAIYFNNTFASGTSLNIASNSSISWLSIGANAVGTLNTAGTVNLYSYGQSATATGVAYTMTFGSGTWNIGQMGQNNSQKFGSGTTNILGGSTVNLGSSIWATQANAIFGGSNGGGFLHGIYNIGGASSGALAITGGFNQTGGNSATVPNAAAINGLQITVGNGGAFSTTAASTLGYANSQVAGQTTGQATNSLTLNSGGTISMTGAFNIGSTTAQASIATTNSVTINGGTFNNAGALNMGQTGLGHTFAESNSVTVSGGTLNITGGGVTMGPNSATGNNYNNTITINGGTMIVGTAASTQNLNVGSSSTLNSTNVANDTVTLSSGKLIVSGTISNLGATNNFQNSIFNWTGGQLTAGTIKAGANMSASSGTSGGITQTGLLNTSGTLAPGDIGQTGKTIITGNYTQNSGGTLAMDLGGTTASTSFQDAANAGKFDNLSVSGTTVLDGTLTASLINGSGGTTFIPTSGNSFIIINSTGALSGTFTNAGAKVVLGNDPFSGSLAINYGANTVTLNNYTANEWQGNGGSNAWGTGGTAVWTNAVDPNAAGAGAKFGSAGTGAATVTLDANRIVGQMLFSSANYTIGGSSTLTLDNGASAAVITLQDTNTQTISAPIVLNSDLTVTGFSGGKLVLGDISGSKNLTANVTGSTLALNGSSSYVNTTIASGATVQVGNGGTTGTLGSGTVANAGTLAFNRTDTGLSVSNVISGAGNVTQLGSGTTTLSGVNTYTGTTAVSAGTLKLSGSGTLGAATSTLGVIASGAALDLNGTNQTVAGFSGTSAGQIINNSGSGTSVLTIGGGSANSFAGILADNNGVSGGKVGLALTGTGAVTLSGANTYSGGTTVGSTSTLTLGVTSVNTGSVINSGPTGTGGVTFANGASLSNTSNGNAWYVPTITLQGTLNLIGTQRQSLSFNTLELTSGTKTLNVNGKSVAVTGGNTLGSESTGLSQWEMQNITGLGTSTIQSSSSAGVLDLETTAFTGQTVGGGTGNYAAMRINNPTSFSNTDLIIGNNVLLFAANTGVLGNSAATSPNVTVNGILDLVASGTTGRTVSVKSLAGAGSVFGSMVTTANTTTLALNGTTGSTTFSGTINNGPGTGALSLSKTGASTQILSGANTYTGTTTISAGTLQLGATNVINNSATNTIVLSGGTLQSAFSQNLNLATLSLTASSTLDLSTGGIFAFADSSASSWTGTLSIVGTFTDTLSVRFGTTSGGLTIAQLGQISLNGQAAGIDASGYLFTSVPEPSTYAALAGALALVGAMVYRRRKSS